MFKYYKDITDFCKYPQNNLHIWIVMKMLECPCKTCESRRLHCHAHCEKYDAYKGEWIKIKKELEKAAGDAAAANKYSR